jgi:pimeloyl-ACP methyl ester carboxylesterase
MQTFAIQDFRLESGVVMPAVTIAYRTLGRLAPNRDNAVLVTHGNTSGPQMIDPGGSTGEGSWKDLVGPGKPVDTNRYFAICPNMLGSSYGSTNAASIDPATGKPYGPRFPDITVGDIVATQYALIDHLGIEKLVAIVGPSYGGFQGFQWAVNYPDRMRGIAAVVTSPSVPRERSAGNLERLTTTLSKDPNWNGGDFYDRGGVLEAMIQIRSDAENLRHRDAPCEDDVGSETDRSCDPRRSRAMGARVRRQLSPDPGEGAARFRHHAAIPRHKGEGALRAVAHRPAVSAGACTRRHAGAEECRRRCRLFPARQRVRAFGVRSRCGKMGTAASPVHGEPLSGATPTRPGGRPEHASRRA